MFLLSQVIFYVGINLSLILYFIGIGYIPLSYIFGSLCGKLTFLTASYPIIFQSSLIGKFFIFYKLIWKPWSFMGLLYKMPSLISIFLFSLLNWSQFYFYIFYASYMFLISVFFIFIFQKTYLYSVFWIIMIVFTIFKIFKKKKISLIEKAIFITWANQATGTIFYGIASGFLSNDIYISIIPIVILERILSVGIYFISLFVISFIYRLFDYFFNYKYKITGKALFYE